MIPVNDIIVGNLYSQNDAQFLLGSGFSKAAAKEAICEACRSGQLESKRWRRRYWFTGANYLSWVREWFGSEVGVARDGDSGLARLAPLGHDALANPEPARRPGRR